MAEDKSAQIERLETQVKEVLKLLEALWGEVELAVRRPSKSGIMNYADFNDWKKQVLEE